MSDRVSHEELMRYLDGEVGPEERNRIEGAVGTSTELRRELAVSRAMKDDLQTLKLNPGGRDSSVWHAVNRQLARPFGWLLLIVGSLVWAAYGIYMYVTSEAFFWQKLATGGVGIGILVLLASVIWERYRVWLTDPYKDLQR